MKIDFWKVTWVQSLKIVPKTTIMHTLQEYETKRICPPQPHEHNKYVFLIFFFSGALKKNKKKLVYIFLSN